MRPLFVISIASAALLALPAAPAAPKGGVRAVAEGEVRLATPAGERMRVTWRLEDEDGRPFGASGIYLRVSRCAGKPRLVAARSLGEGRYTARFTVPRRGIRKLMVGLEGWRTVAGGSPQRADAIFNFVPALGRRCR